MVIPARVLLTALALMAAMPALSQASNTRSEREEIERLLDAAPRQSGVSRPSAFPFSKEADDFKPAELKERKDILWDVGGWSRSTLTTFDTQFGNDRTIFDQDLRVWGQVELGRAFSAYGRLRSFYANSQSSGNGGDEDNWQNVRVDQAYARFDLGYIAKAPQTTEAEIVAGRQFFFLGNGAALANVLEGVRFAARVGEWNFDVLAAKTIHNSPDFDASVPKAEPESDRLFIGGQVSTTAFAQRLFYFYFLTQVDLNDYREATQAWDYDSTYLGIGHAGALPIPGLRANELSLSAEGILQLGKAMADNTHEEEDIEAYALLLDLTWLPGDRLPIKSKAVLSYYFGSGDSDRGDAHTVANGNAAGTNDNAFNYFGFVGTGFALAPRLTNLHMLRLNYEATVFEDAADWIRVLKVGTSLFSFWRHHSEGPITDVTAINDDRHLGYEVDVYADLKLASDLNFGLRYGAFFPEDAFTKSRVRQFLSVFLNVSF